MFECFMSFHNDLRVFIVVLLGVNDDLLVVHDVS